MIDDYESRWVYLIGSTLARPVKIGVARNTKARLDELRVGSPVPLHLMWKTRGGRVLEASLHEYFAAYRLHGEWFDFEDEDPAALVATAAVLMGSPSHPQRVATTGHLQIVHHALVPDVPSMIGHLLNAASATGHGSVTKAEAFAHLVTVDPEFTRGAEEAEEQYRSRAGKRLAMALRAEGIAIRPTKVPGADGRRVYGYHIAQLKSALSARFEQRQPARGAGKYR